MPLLISQNILAENIITALGIQALPHEQKQVLVDKMVDLVNKRLLLRLLNDMNKNDAAKLEALSLEPAKLRDFLIERFPNFMQMLTEEIEKLKVEMLAATVKPA